MDNNRREIVGNSGQIFSKWARETFKASREQVYKVSELYEQYKEYAVNSHFPVLRKKVFRHYLNIHLRDRGFNMKVKSFYITSISFTY